MISKDIINMYAINAISFLTPNFIQRRRLNMLESKAELIAISKKIPFLIRCRIMDENERKPDSFSSIGFSYQFEQMVNGKYNIYIYKQAIMAPERDILKTIFHEYGHFIDYCTSIQTKTPLKELHRSNRFPIIYDGSFSEDFAELFAIYLLGSIPIEFKVATLMDDIVREGASNLSNSEMKRSIDLLNY
jgi:hypothetical protein